MSAHPPLKFIHCADLRLDSPFEGVQALEPEIADTLRRATFVAFDRVIDTAIAEACDFVAIAGNVFDARNHSLQAQLRFGEAMRRLGEHGIGCFIAHGPADPLSSWEASVPLPESAHRFTAAGDWAAVVRDGVEVARVCGASWAAAGVPATVSALAGQSPEGPFTVGVVHLGDGDTDSVAALEASGVGYWALGGSLPAVLRGHSPFVVRSGSPQGLSASEVGQRGCQLVTVSEEGVVDSRPVPTAAVVWYDEKLDVGGCTTWDQVVDAAFTKREEVRGLADGVPALLRLDLVGRSAAAGRLRRADPERDVAALMRDGEGDRPDFVWLAGLTVAVMPLVDLAQRRQVEDLAGDFLRSGMGVRQASSPAEAVMKALAAHPEERAVASFLAELSEEDLLAVLAEAEALGLELLLGEAR